MTGTKYNQNFGQGLLGKFKTFLVMNLLTLIVILMAYKPPKIDASDDSSYVYIEIGKYLMIFFLLAEILFFIARLYLSHEKKIRFAINYLLISIPFFCLYIAISGNWNLSPVFSKASLGVATFNLVQFVTIFLIFYFVSIDNHIRYLATFFVYISFILTCVAIPEALSSPLGYRLASLAGDSTAFGSFSALGVISTGHLCSNRQKQGVSFFVLQIAFILALIFSGTRNAILALFFAWLTYQIFTGRFAMKFRFSMSTFFQRGFFFIIALAAGGYAATRDFFGLFARGDSLEHSRAFIWGVVYSMFIEGSAFNKVFGNGFGFLKENFRSAHNTYLQILIEYGALFLIVLICYLFCVLCSIFRLNRFVNDNSDRAYLASILVFISIFSFSLNVLFVGVFSICYVSLCAISAIIFYKKIHARSLPYHQNIAFLISAPDFQVEDRH